MSKRGYWDLWALAAMVSISSSDEGGSPAEPSQAPRNFAERVAKAHGAENWYAHPAVEAGIEVAFREEPPVKGRLLFTTAAVGARMERGNAVAVFDGETAWVSPADAPFPRARFHLLTWPYFIAAPFRLTDSGARLEELDEPFLQAENYHAAKMTFATGGSPDDWYILHADPADHTLTSVTFIGTLRSSEAPHMIHYDEFRDLDGARVPVRASFWVLKDKEAGTVADEPIGSLNLSNPRFVSPAPGAFQAPPGAREEKLPG